MIKNNKVRLAFIGCGPHATTCLYPCLRLILQAELVAVCDLKEELALRNAKAFGAKSYYTDLEKMLSREELDAAIIVGPPQMHCQVGKLCLEHGLHIFVEKPPGIISEEARKLAEIADKQKLFGMVAFMKRFSPIYLACKEIITQKEFGGLNFLEGKFSNGPYPALWGIKENTKSFLIGQVIHIFDLIRFLSGEVKEVYATLNEVEEDRFGYGVNLRFTNGLVGLLNLNTLDFETWRFNERISLSGRDRFLEAIDMLQLYYHQPDTPISKNLPPGDMGNYWRPVGPGMERQERLIGYLGELEHFVEAVANDQPPSPNLWDGVEALNIAEAVWESVQTNKVIKLEQ